MCRPDCMGALRSTTGSSAAATKTDELRSSRRPTDGAVAGRSSLPAQVGAESPPPTLPSWGSLALGVGVVVVPPLVRRGLRVPLRRVLPCLLAAEGGEVEVVPGAPHLLVAAGVDEVGAEDPVALADKGVGAVPLVDPEVLVEVVGERVPGDVLPPMALLQALDLGLGGARGEHQRRVPRVQVGGVGDLVGAE